MEPIRDCAGNPINRIDPSGHDAILLNASKAVDYVGGAVTMGHTALAIQKKKRSKTWTYITFTSKKLDKFKFQLPYRSALPKDGSTVAKSVGGYINNYKRKVEKVAYYDAAIYIKGKFKDHKYISKDYNLVLNNCSQRSISVLLAGKFSKNATYCKTIFMAALFKPVPNEAFRFLVAGSVFTKTLTPVKI